MKSTLISLAAAAVLSAAAGATPAVAAMPGAPVANAAIEFKTDAQSNGVVQVRHFGRRYVSRRVCRRWHFLGYTRGIPRYRHLYRRYCRGGHHVSFRQCRRWFHLGYRVGLPRYRHLHRRYCRWYR